MCTPPYDINRFIKIGTQTVEINKVRSVIGTLLLELDTNKYYLLKHDDKTLKEVYFTNTDD